MGKKKNIKTHAYSEKKNLIHTILNNFSRLQRKKYVTNTSTMKISLFRKNLTRNNWACEKFKKFIKYIHIYLDIYLSTYINIYLYTNYNTYNTPTKKNRVQLRSDTSGVVEVALNKYFPQWSIQWKQLKILCHVVTEHLKTKTITWIKHRILQRVIIRFNIWSQN